MNARPPKTAMKQIEADKQSICVMPCLSLKSISFVHRPSRRSLCRNPGSLIQMDCRASHSVRGLVAYADRSLLSFRTINTLIHFSGTNNFKMWFIRRYSAESDICVGYLKIISIISSDNY